MCKCKNCCFEVIAIILLLIVIFSFTFIVLYAKCPTDNTFKNAEQFYIQDNYALNYKGDNNKLDLELQINGIRNVDFYPIVCITIFISLAAVLIFLIWILSKDDSDIKYSKLEMLEELNKNCSEYLKSGKFEKTIRYVNTDKDISNTSVKETTTSQNYINKDLIKHYMTCIAEV